MKPSISVVIPNYNGEKLLKDNLPSVISALKMSGSDYEIIIADDCSQDDSVDFLRRTYPDIRLIESQQNKGFAINANKGIKKAQNQLVLLLNSDVKLSENYFESQFKYFEKPDTFGVMGSIYSSTGKISDAAKYPFWRRGHLKTTKNFYIKNKEKNFFCPSLFLSGANALIDRNKLLQLRGFSEIFSPFYMEDADLCIRAWRHGWKCYYEPDATCVHSLSETIKKHNTASNVRQIAKRNRMLFNFFHLSGYRRLLWIVEMTTDFFIKWLLIDFSFYNSFKEFILLKKTAARLEASKSLSEVIEEIRTSVKHFEKGYF
jgi:GT2 family glycosyltransferase